MLVSRMRTTGDSTFNTQSFNIQLIPSSSYSISHDFMFCVIKGKDRKWPPETEELILNMMQFRIITFLQLRVSTQIRLITAASANLKSSNCELFLLFCSLTVHKRVFCLTCCYEVTCNNTVCVWIGSLQTSWSRCFSVTRK